MREKIDQIDTPAHRLRLALEYRNLKQSELADKTGLSRPSINAYILGKYEPKHTALYKMGKALDISEMWLAGFDVPMERPAFMQERDRFTDMIDRLYNDDDFKAIAININELNPEQLQTLRNLLEAFRKQ